MGREEYYSGKACGMCLIVNHLTNKTDGISLRSFHEDVVVDLPRSQLEVLNTIRSKARKENNPGVMMAAEMMRASILFGYRDLTVHNPARRTFTLDVTWKFNEARSKYRGSGAGEKQKARM